MPSVNEYKIMRNWSLGLTFIFLGIAFWGGNEPLSLILGLLGLVTLFIFVTSIIKIKDLNDDLKEKFEEVEKSNAHVPHKGKKKK